LQTLLTVRAYGIVLRTIDYGEADRVVTLLLRQGGKVGAMARGAQKSKKRFAGALELGTILDLDLTSSTRRQLMGITRTDLVRSYLSLGGDILAFAFSSYALELVREFTPDREGDAALFDLCAGYLESLAKRGPELFTLRLFELALLGHLGYSPDLSRCRDCGKAAVGLSSFYPALGGLRCDSCDPEGRGGVLLGHGTAQKLLALAREGAALFDQLGGEREVFQPEPLPAPRTVAEERVAREGGRLIGRYVEHLLGRRVKSLAFLEELSTAP
jgi:DNA repair protein RecO (recombination protein O)